MPTPDPYFTDRSTLVAASHPPDRARQIDREDREDLEWAQIERDHAIADERADIGRYGR